MYLYPYEFSPSSDDFVAAGFLLVFKQDMHVIKEVPMLRREFLKLCTAAAVIPSVVSLETVFAEPASPVVPNTITDVKPGEDVFAYLIRVERGA